MKKLDFKNSHLTSVGAIIRESKQSRASRGNKGGRRGTKRKRTRKRKRKRRKEARALYGGVFVLSPPQASLLSVEVQKNPK